MATPTHDHAVELREMAKKRDELQTHLDAANTKLAEFQVKAEGFEKLQLEFNALKTKYTEAEKS